MIAKKVNILYFAALRASSYQVLTQNCELNYVTVGIDLRFNAA